MDEFWRETRIYFSNGGSTSHDTPHEYGFVEGIWHGLEVNGTEVPVYSARCGQDIHSFAWVDIDTDGLFTLDVELRLFSKDKNRVVVLPEKLGVEAEMKNGVVTAELTEYGSYSFAFDESADKALTLYVAPVSEVNAPSGWETVTFEPGKYTAEETTFSEQNTVYYFKKGVYDLTSITMVSNSILYFESGTSVRVYEATEGDYHAALRINSGHKNMQIKGRVLFDFSKCMGGDAKTKGVYSFHEVDGLDVEGIITINSNNWSMCSNYSKNVHISRCMFFSYRTYSDGVMFSDCRNSTAKNCFVRTGDDAMEVKAFSDSTAADASTDNILFENNCVWTDKGIGYGCIYESKHNVKNVIFRNNSIGFAQASWSEHLGCCTMQMGSEKEAIWQNVYFENIEIYKTNCAMASIYNRAKTPVEGGRIQNIFFKDITVKYAERTNLPVYCINVVVRLGEGASPINSLIGMLYFDNITYLGTRITADNYADYANIALDEGAIFQKASIKINTLSGKEVDD